MSIGFKWQFEFPFSAMYKMIVSFSFSYDRVPLIKLSSTKLVYYVYSISNDDCVINYPDIHLILMHFAKSQTPSYYLKHLEHNDLNPFSKLHAVIYVNSFQIKGTLFETNE